MQESTKQNIKIVLGVVGISLLLVVVFQGSNKRAGFLGAVEIPADSACNSVVTSTAVTVQHIAPARTEAQVLNIANLSVGDIRISATTTNIHAGILIKASTTREFTIEQGNMLRGILYASGSNATAGALTITRCP